ncbi:unnamed protein product, partial [Owenia fusiformis]
NHFIDNNQDMISNEELLNSVDQTNSNEVEEETYESSAMAQPSIFFRIKARLIPQNKTTSSKNLPIEERTLDQTTCIRSLCGVLMHKISKGKIISHIAGLGKDTIVLVKGKTTMESIILDENFKEKNNFCKCGKCRSVVVTHDRCIILLHDEGIDIYKENGNWQRRIERPKGLRCVNIAMNNYYSELIVADTKTNTIVYIDYNTGEVNHKTQAQPPIFAECSEGENIAVNQNNDLIVSSMEKKSVTGYNSRGVQILQYTGEGVNMLSSPAGICVDKNNNIIVADTKKDNVQLLSQDGTFQKILLSSREGLQCPCSVAVTNDGYLLVGNRVGDIFRVKY